MSEKSLKVSFVADTSSTTVVVVDGIVGKWLKGMCETMRDAVRSSQERTLGRRLARLIYARGQPTICVFRHSTSIVLPTRDLNCAVASFEQNWRLGRPYRIHGSLVNLRSKPPAFLHAIVACMHRNRLILAPIRHVQGCKGCVDLH